MKRELSFIVRLVGSTMTGVIIDRIDEHGHIFYRVTWDGTPGVDPQLYREQELEPGGLSGKGRDDRHRKALRSRSWQIMKAKDTQGREPKRRTGYKRT